MRNWTKIKTCPKLERLKNLDPMKNRLNPDKKWTKMDENKPVGNVVEAVEAALETLEAVV